MSLPNDIAETACIWLNSGLIRLDVSQHMSLCRHYVRELRRSVLVETPELEKQGSKRSSYVLDHYDLNEVSGPSANREKIKDANLSAYLRQENGGVRAVHSAHSSLGSQQSGLQSNGGDRPYNNNNGRPPRASLMSNNMNRTNSGSPAHTVARADLRASAEKILYTFLLPGSEREIILPQNLLNDIIASIEEDGRDDPEVFDAAKDYTFQAMERDAFPGFLRSKALGNLVPPSSFLRLCLGLLGMFGGFWAGFACIFLNKPKHIRCWVGTTFSPLPCLPVEMANNVSPVDSPLYYRRLLSLFATISHRPGFSSSRA